MLIGQEIQQRLKIPTDLSLASCCFCFTFLKMKTPLFQSFSFWKVPRKLLFLLQKVN